MADSTGSDQGIEKTEVSLSAVLEGPGRDSGQADW